MKFAYLAVFAVAPLCAQVMPGGLLPTTFISPQQSFTTGMVGFTVNQTARLNVLNLNPTTAVLTTTGVTTTTTTPANCTVELAFYDSKGTQISQTVVPNFAPGTATSFDLPRASVTSGGATGRAEIRGVVTVNPTPTPVGAPSSVGYCSVLTTLEVFDVNGSTISSTSDTRPLSAYYFTGIPASTPAK